MSYSNRKSLLAGAALIAAAWATPAAHASPLMVLSLQGRVTGSGDPFSSTVTVASAGQSIDYQIVADMAPLGTTNSNGSRTITSLTVGTDGSNSMKFDAFELATQQIQMDFATSSVLNPDPSPVANDSWAGTTGNTGGTPTLRAGGQGNDLIGIRPVHAAGVNTAVDPEVVTSGTFLVASLGSGASSLVGMREPNVAAQLKINGSTTILPNGTTESGLDPYFGFVPLTVNSVVAPEPTSLSMLGIAAVGLLARRRKA